jgi:predicted enzyme related to lactoylglutathione lyase
VSGTSRSLVAAVGIVVADLDRAERFYSDAFGFVRQSTFDLDHLAEVILGNPAGKGASLVLMRYKDEQDRSHVDVGQKVVLMLEDPVAAVDGVRAAGGEVTAEPEQHGALLVGFAKDPDGHTLELLQLPKRREG